MKSNNLDAEYLFVYGTLRKGIDIPINKKIGNDLEWIGVGIVNGGLYDIGNYPGAINEQTENVFYGDLFKLISPEKTLQILDKYERYDVLKPYKSDYLREKVMVNLENEQETAAWIYWYNQSVTGKYKIAEGDYLEYLKKKKTA